jgi:hypothetical protein
LPATPHAFILPGLIADAGDQGDQLREIAAVEHELADLLSGDHTRELRGLRFHLRHGRACTLISLVICPTSRVASTRAFWPTRRTTPVASKALKPLAVIFRL